MPESTRKKKATPKASESTTKRKTTPKASESTTKRKTTPKTSETIPIDTKKTEAENEVIQPFSDHFNTYLESLGKIHEKGINEYQIANADFTEMVEDFKKRGNESRESVDADLKNSMKEAWRKGDYSKIYGPEYYAAINSYSLAQNDENKSVEDVSQQYTERIQKLNDSNKVAYQKAFELHTANVKSSWSKLKTEEVDANTLYSIGYLNLAASWYNYLASF